MIKLIVSDMDGTFLNDNNEIDERFWDIFEEMKRRGILFSPASGRQYFSLADRFEKIREDILFIAENGTFVMYGERELFSSCLSDIDVKYALEKLKKVENIAVVLCGKKSAYIENSDPEFIKEIRKYYHRYEIVENLDNVKEDILKIAIYDFVDSETNCYPYFKEDDLRFKVAVSGKHWIDIMHLDSNKGEAIKKVMKIFGLKRDEIAVFGDYLNDLEMMGEVEHSYAMENAHPEIKRVAKYIAKSNNESGVLKEIIKIMERF